MDKFEMIKQFKDLLDNGVITQEEFDQKKKELLSIGSEVRPQADLEPTVEAPINELSVSEETEVESATIIEEPEDVVKEAEIIPNEQGLTSEQKASSKKSIIIAVAAAVALILLISMLVPSRGVKGSWNCSSVVYAGEKLDASEAQMDDYTLKFTSSTFEANIYGAEVSGTYKYSDTITLDDGMEVDTYTLTAESGAELIIAYYKSEDVITLSPFGGVSSSTFIEFKRR